MTPEQIAKLPKWAQEEIKSLACQRDIAVCRLDEMTDNQTPSPWFKDEFDCTTAPPEYRKVYFQSGISMKVCYAGIEVDITLRDNDRINIGWSSPQHGTDHVAMIPESFQSVNLIAKQNLR